MFLLQAACTLLMQPADAPRGLQRAGVAVMADGVWTLPSALTSCICDQPDPSYASNYLAMIRLMGKTSKEGILGSQKESS